MDEGVILIAVVLACVAYCGAAEGHDKTQRYVECVRHHPPIECEEPTK